MESVKSFIFLQFVIPAPSSLLLRQNICLQLFHFSGKIAGIGASCLLYFYYFDFHYYPYGFLDMVFSKMCDSQVSWHLIVHIFYSATLLSVTCFFGQRGGRLIVIHLSRPCKPILSKKPKNKKTREKRRDRKKNKPAQKKVPTKQNSCTILLII